MPTTRQAVSAVVDKNVIYVIGGETTSGYLATVESYNTTLLGGYGSRGSPAQGRSRALRLTARPRFPKAPGRTADVHHVSRKRRCAVSGPDRENRRGVGTMDKVRALIIDDSSVMRKIVERSLRQAGIELEKVVEAANGAEGMAALQDNVFDLILCDINMPVMDGLEFVRQAATVANAKGVPIVMITTEGSESHVVAALSAGARGYIRKPFTPDQVKEHVLSLLGKKP
jgi:two-component system chemotaxis response regulator CheY